MGNTALQQRPPSSPAHSGAYNGVETALDFGDPAGELAALREQAGVFDLGWRAKVTVGGKDRVRWLHNMVTNNVRDLALHRGYYNFVLNAQGRILGDMYIYNRGDSLLFDTDRAQVETLVTAMKRFIIMDKVELTPNDGIRSIGICGPKAAAALQGAGIEVEGPSALEFREQKLGEHAFTVVRGPENKPDWYELWGDEAGLAAARDKLIAAGAKPVGARALEWWRILKGIPHYGQDIRDRDLPQETAQTQAVNFTKGCYIGQEIVERIRSRGQVHRTFTGFEFPGTPAAIGKYEAAGRAFAELTSTAVIPLAAGARALGLGYIREEARAAGPEVDLNGVKARIADLPFAI
ncbi:MAG TPA: folate-binding protein [Candidatus Angelobacter sp.]|nr:folate-binding protein [Candidatus Angelobacter sp.]